MDIIFISLLFGGVVFLVIWNVAKLFQDVPEEDRYFLDRPAVGFRLVWPLIQLTNHFLGGFLSVKYRQATLTRLCRAGQDYMLTAEQFFSAKIVAMVIATLCSFLLRNMLEQESILLLFIGAVSGYYYPELWLKETTNNRNRSMYRDLPFYLDVIVLAVEAGTNFIGGLNQAVSKAPSGPLRQEFLRVLRDIRAGKPRQESLRALSERASSEGINNVVGAIIQAEKTGSRLGPVLRAQAEQLRSSRFLKAEKLAMEAPVKLLGPLVLFIFPNTFLIIIFVMLSSAIQKGVITFPLMVWAFNWPG